MATKKIFLALVFIGITFLANAQLLVPNIDFETGSLTPGWQYFKGTVADGPIYTLASCAPTPKLHTLTSGTDTDYYGGFPIVGNGHYSLKLNDESCGRKAEGARYVVRVPVGIGA
jgi:hypothetical protein